MNSIKVKASLIVCVFFLILNTPLLAQNDSNGLNKVSDGPYVFISEDGLIEKTISDGKVLIKNLDESDYIHSFEAQESVYKDVENIAALSDIHGQFDLAIEILRNNKIIDKNNKWIYGKGHFVIVGDIFDRGPKVTETLWFVYELEKQAAAAGGKVHFLLGNHEYMVMRGDVRYIHEKYKESEKLLEMEYQELFSDKTVLGKWLRSKATMIKINDILYVHGGISSEFIKEGFDINAVNKEFRNSIDISKEVLSESNFYEKYYRSSGPIWYRGYFRSPIQEQELDLILSKISSKHLVVGHCSNETIVSLYNNKVFGVDSSIKKGEYGEILFIERKKFVRATMSGEKKEFN